VSLRWRLFFALAVPVLAGAAGAGGLLAHRLRADAVARLERELPALAVQYADRVDRRLDAAAAVARGLAASLSVGQAPSEDTLRELVRTSVVASPLVDAVTVAVLPGVVPGRTAPFIAYAQRSAEGPVAGEVAARTQGEPVRLQEGAGPLWTGPFAEPLAGGAPRVRHEVPFQRRGRPAGVAAVDLDLQALQSRLAPDPVDRYRFVVLDAAGRFLSHPDGGLVGTETVQGLAREMRLAALARLADRLATGDPGAARLESFGTPEPHWVFYAPLPTTGWRFVAAASERELLAGDRARERVMLLGLGGLSGVLVLLGLVTAARFARPVERLAATAAELTGRSPGQLALGRFGGDELGRVAEAMYLLADNPALYAARAGEREGWVPAKELSRLLGERDGEAREYRRVVQERDSQVARLDALERERQDLEGRVSRAEASLVEAARQAEQAQAFACAVQLETLPAPLRSEDVEVCGRVVRSEGLAGGLVDFFGVPGGRVALVSGDGSAGAGLDAARAGLVRLLVRPRAEAGEPPATLLAEVGRALARAGGGRVSLGLLVLCYDPQTGELDYANGAHPPPLAVDPKGVAHPLGEAGPVPVGADPEASYRRGIATLEPGECLVITTGAAGPSARGGGAEATIRDLLARSPGAPADALCRAIGQALGAALGERAGATVLVLRRLPATAPDAKGTTGPGFWRWLARRAGRAR
jgi:sigma-B regulation protein RsbU (phosphoserine phosphatase)